MKMTKMTPKILCISLVVNFLSIFVSISQFLEEIISCNATGSLILLVVAAMMGFLLLLNFSNNIWTQLSDSLQLVKCLNEHNHQKQT